MMLRGNDVIGIPITVPDDKEVPEERTQNWILDLDSQHLLGFVVRHGGWTGSVRVLLWGSILNLTPQMLVTVYSLPVIEISQVVAIKRALEHQQPIIGFEIVTRSNTRLGKIIDLYFDESSGRVTGFATTGGVFQGIHAESLFVPLSGTTEIIDDKLVIEPEIIQQMQQPEHSVERRDPPQNDKGRALSTVAGRRTAWTVRRKDGLIVAAAGQIITPEIIQAVRDHEMESDLMMAVDLPV